ncbi:hypothetical protein KP509_1Z158100 [Ceratopteris richardii]|nr:hypothetical protein KP509_1Z158100 [Ceratopteris richardii]
MSKVVESLPKQLATDSLPKDVHRQKRPDVFTWFCVLLSTVSAMLMGYDIGIMSGAILFIQEELHLSLFEEEVVVGSLNLFAAFGSLASGVITNFFGRRKALLVASTLFFVGAVVLAASVDFGLLLVGRLLTGLGVGFAMMIAPLYSAEISPASVRGFLVSFTEVFVNVGILLGYIIGFAFQFLSPAYNWRLMLGAGALPAILLAVGVLVVLPESPRWLVLQGRNEEARDVLRDVVCGKNEAEAQRRLEEIMLANEEEGGDGAGCFSSGCRSLRNRNEAKRMQTSDGEHWITSPLARMYVIAIGINFFQQATGIDALVYYSPVVFKRAGVHGKVGKLGATVGMGVMKLAFVLVATYLLDFVGRKKLLYVSATGIIACLTTVAVTFVLLGLNSAEGDSLIGVNEQKVPARSSVIGEAVTIAAIVAYVAFFSVGFGPISYVLTSEIFPLRHRSTAVGVSVFVNRIVSGTVSLTFLSIAKGVTPAGTFGLFAGLTAMSLLFVWMMVPETKGRTLEEITHLFARPNPAPSIHGVDAARISSCSTRIVELAPTTKEQGTASLTPSS